MSGLEPYMQKSGHSRSVEIMMSARSMEEYVVE